MSQQSGGAFGLTADHIRLIRDFGVIPLILAALLWYVMLPMRDAQIKYLADERVDDRLQVKAMNEISAAIKLQNVNDSRLLDKFDQLLQVNRSINREVSTPSEE